MNTAPLALFRTDPGAPLDTIATRTLAHLPPNSTLLEAVRLMARLRISSVLVLDNDRHPLGILTEGRLLQLLHAATPPQTALAEAMVPPVTVPATIDCAEAYQRCLREGVHHLILVDEQQRAVAVVSDSDYRRHLDFGISAGQTRVCSIMSRGVAILTPDTPLRTALDQMHTRTTGVVVVVDERHAPVGILSQRDLARLYLSSSSLEDRTLAEVMTTPVRTLPMDTILADAAAAMLADRVRQYPVVDKTGALLGVLAARDLTQAMAFGVLEDSLNREQEQLRRLLEQAPFPLVITRIDTGLICYINSRAEHQFHVARDELIGQTVERFYLHPTNRLPLLERLRREGHVFDQELLLVDANGQPFTALVSLSLVDFDRQPAILTAVNDITKRKQFEQELMFRNVLLSTQQEASIDGILIVDEHDRVLSCNRRFAEMWQIPEEILSQPDDRPFLAHVSKQVSDPEGFVQRVRQLYRQRQETSRDTTLLADGRVFDRYTAPMFGDDHHYFGRVWFFRDITEQQQVAQLLQRERAKLQWLFQAIPEPLWAKNPEGRFLLCNPAFERLFGASEAEIIGRTDYDFIPREQADFFRASDRRTIEAGRPMVNEEWLEIVDGSPKVLFETIKTPLRDTNGALAGVLGIARDITKRRREQRTLRERIKEQQCLYRIFALTEEVAAPFSRQLQEVVRRIPRGWTHPETTRARIEFEGAAYVSPGFRESDRMQTMEVTTEHGAHLRLTIAYLDPARQEDEKPFLKEKLKLAEAIVHRLAEVVERRYVIATVESRDRLIATMFAQTTDAIILVDAHTDQIVDFNTAAHDGLGYTSEEFAGLRVADIQAEYSPEQIAANTRSILLSEEVCLETRHRHKNGTLRDVALTLRPLTLNGRPLVSAVWRDITDQKARERALAESEKRLKTITDSALDAILMLDETGCISYWNPAAETIFGYSAEEALGKNLHCLLAPNHHQAAHRDAFPRFLETGKGKVVGTTIELTALRKDGATIAISLSLSSVFLNECWHAVGIVRDITGIKQNQASLEAALEVAENANRAASEVLAHLEELVKERTAALDAVNERLRISEERYTHALAATTDGLWDWNLVTGELYCNPAYYRMLGYEPGELANNPTDSVTNLIHPEDRRRIDEAIQHLIADRGSNELEFRMLAKNGDIVWVLSRGKVVSRGPDGRPLRAVGIHTDLTARKQIEMALALAAEEQQAIFNAAGMGIFLVRNRVIVRCNHKLEEVFGYEPGELAGHTTECWYLSRDDFHAWGRRITHALRIDGIFHDELQLRRKDGTLFWARTTAQAVDSRDFASGVVGMIEDITEERAASEALQKAKEDAEAATRAKSEFLANMSHEIRTPLNAILGFAHLIKRDPLSLQQRNQLDKLTDASRHLLHVINNILDISKIEANKMTLQIGDFEPARVIHQVCSIVSDTIAAKNLKLRLDLGDIPPMVRGDGPRIGQILLNLMGNAVKFTDQGQVAISVRKLARERHRLLIRFEIRDTGIGLSEEQLARIFVAFEQADGSTTRRFGGTGLGLAISKRLVELMGGRIGVESRLGAGTLFWFEVPFTSSTQLPPMRLQGDTLKGIRVLVIDDSPESREIMAAMLDETGMGVTTVASGEEGLAEVVAADQAGQPYGVLIVDWRLGGIDGIEVVERLRRLDLSSQPASIMVSAYSDDLPLDRAIRAGIDKIVTKPLTPSLLFDALMETMPPATPHGETEGTKEQALLQRSGAKILLVEDNLINQEVAFMLLESMNMEISVADNGEAAVTLMEQHDFDLVFMDVQMPVMDGLAATRAIRRLPGCREVPILAITANAFGEDRERCLAAGMNDHIAKPIELEKLQAVLIKWLPIRRPSLADHADQQCIEDATSLTDGDVRLLAIDGLDETVGLRLVHGDREKYWRLLAQFVRTHGEAGISLTAAAATKDWDILREQAHALKGAAATLGARHIAERAEALEQWARNPSDALTLHARFDALQAALQNLCRSVSPFLTDGSVAESGVTVDRQQARQVLAHLEALLAIDDSAANDEFATHGSLLLAVYGPRVRVLGRQIESFDYADALETTSSLLRS